MTPQEFVTKWSGVTLKEKSSSQPHFMDLCKMLGVPDPIEEDQSGDTYTFERGVEKTGDKHGWADVWKKGCFGWEYKGPGKDLENAYKQLLLYKDSLGNPPLLIVSDIQTIEVHTNFTNTPKTVKRFPIDRLVEPRMQDLLRRAWTDPERFRPEKTTEAVTEEAARKFSELAAHLRERGIEPERAAHFLIRLLFCLFAEDTGLLPERLFERLVKSGVNKPAAFNAQLRQLFAAMSNGGYFGEHEITHINGKLFDTDDVVDLERDAISMLGSVTYLDWSAIEPAILGTLFERSLDPSKRSQLGAHYTSKDDILLIVEPVLMAPLRRRWDEVQAEAATLIEKRDGASRGAQTKATNRLRSLLQSFAGEIAEVRVLDPACGSGNFLYVALRELLDLWKEVSVFSRDAGIGLLMPFEGESPSPLQLHGIELNEYAHELAQVTVWIGYIQWLRENGFGTPSEPVLKPIETIENRDAILSIQLPGMPEEAQWPDADVIVGNPPFLGEKKARSELGDGYVNSVRVAYEDQLPGSVDLVTYWFAKAMSIVETNPDTRVGLLATQAIRGGSNRKVLERISSFGKIFFALSDRDWILDGAAVHVSMIGFDGGVEPSCTLDGVPVEVIFPDLTAYIDTTMAARLPENAGISFQGPGKVGPFDINPEIAQELLGAHGNPNARPNSDVIRPYETGADLMRQSRGCFIIDFDQMEMTQASMYSAPFEYVKTHVKPLRDKNRDRIRREYWWRLGRTGAAMRSALDGLPRFIATSQVSKHRVFVWLNRRVMPANTVIVFARSDDYFLGVLQSRVHVTWGLHQGTALEDRPRYTPSSTFETFPFPWPPGKEPNDNPNVLAVSDASRELVEMRECSLNADGKSEADLKQLTLTKLYNARPTWLDIAHRKLDDAVLDAYGWPHDLSDEEILERLLALNLERAAVQE